MNTRPAAPNADPVAGETGNSMVGLRAGETLWLIDLADVSEIIPVPPLFGVPFTQRWFAGVFATRGGLVGVVDFAAFTGSRGVATGDRNRIVLVSPRHGVPSALMFDQVVGPQNPEHFTREQPATPLPDWVESLYRDPEQRAWHALDMRALVEHRSFLAVEAGP